MGDGVVVGSETVGSRVVDTGAGGKGASGVSLL